MYGGILAKYTVEYYHEYGFKVNFNRYIDKESLKTFFIDITICQVFTNLKSIIGPTLYKCFFKKFNFSQRARFIYVVTELVLFLILTFGGSTVRNSWACPLAAGTRTLRELVLFKGSYISSLYCIK